MGAHGFGWFHPDRARAVVAKSGMMLDSFTEEDDPRAKRVVFRASPADFLVRGNEERPAILRNVQLDHRMD